MNIRRIIAFTLFLPSMLFAQGKPTAPATAAFAAPPPRYTVTDLGSLGGCCTFAYSIDNKGQIVGSSYNGASIGRAFLWQNGTMTDLGSFAGRSSQAFGMNEAGQIVGGSDSPFKSQAAFLWQNGVLADLDDHPADSEYPGTAFAINEAGVAVGQAQRHDGVPGPVVFRSGTVTKLPTPALDGNGNPYSVGGALAINDAGQIVGYGDRVALRNGGPVPLLWQGGGYIRLGSLNESDQQGIALAINNSGQIVGWSTASNWRPHAFLWQNGVMSDIGALPGGSDSAAYGINSTGVIVGSAGDTAFVYENGVMYDLEQRIPADSGADLRIATAINDLGQIIVNNGVHAYLLTPTVSADTAPPMISCSAPDGHWHSGDVSIVCSASDSGSGLANTGDANFLLSTSVTAGVEDANARTNNAQVCDQAGNCATAGPIGGNMVDKRPPAIAIVAPIANATFLLNQVVASNFTCSDGGAGISTCIGVSNLDTLSVGTKSFGVNARDAVGNTAAGSVSYSVSYAVFLLSDATKAENNAKVELELRDGNGVNVSSTSIALRAQSIDGTRPLDETFTFTKAKSGAYKYSVPRDVSGGSHLLYFTADGDPSVHSVPFTSR